MNSVGHRYTYDDASRVAARTSAWRTSEDASDPLTVGTVTYGYDHDNQLTGEDRDWSLGDTSYAYDPSGNRTNYTDAAGSTTYTIGAHNRLASDNAGWTYGYDNEGNLTSKESSTEHYQYDYDHRNRLTKVTYSVDGGSGFIEVWHVDNSYDAFDRLVRRKDNLPETEWPNFAGSDKVFSYEHGQIVLALEVYGTQTQRFLWGPKTDQLLATEYNGGYYGGGQIYFPLADAQGTITDAAKFWLENAQTQNYLTTVVMHRDIDAYGRDLSLQTFAAAEIGWQELTYAGPFFVFTGRYTDPLTGLQWNGQGDAGRWYAPDLGRWMNEDMLGLGPDFNPYRYVHNSPTNFTDPSGLAPPGSIADILNGLSNSGDPGMQATIQDRAARFGPGIEAAEDLQRQFADMAGFGSTMELTEAAIGKNLLIRDRDLSASERWWRFGWNAGPAMLGALGAIVNRCRGVKGVSSGFKDEKRGRDSFLRRRRIAPDPENRSRRPGDAVRLQPARPGADRKVVRGRSQLSIRAQ